MTIPLGLALVALVALSVVLFGNEPGEAAPTSSTGRPDQRTLHPGTRLALDHA